MIFLLNNGMALRLTYVLLIIKVMDRISEEYLKKYINPGIKN